MLYLVGLLAIIVIFFSTLNGGGVVNDYWQKAKDKVLNTALPKSEREIAVENLSSDYELLDRFFTKSVPNILQLDGITDDDRKNILGASSAFFESKDDLATLQETEGSLTKSIIQKVFNLNEKASSSAETTPIPANCEVVCSEE